MGAQTITECLAELKTIGKRLEAKRQYVGTYLLRDSRVVDPLQQEGGSVEGIRRERQAIHDLEERTVRIRSAIALANAATPVTVTLAGANGAPSSVQTRSVADWLTWRRDVAPGTQGFLESLRAGIERHRQQVQAKGQKVTSVADGGQPNQQQGDVAVNISETELHRQIEALQETLGVLDGLLSLKNATTVVEIAD